MSEVAVHTQSEDQDAQIRPKVRLLPEGIEKRYRSTINALVDDARENDSTAILVDVLAWTIARSIVGCRTRWGAGDVVRRIGEEVCKLADREAAQAEAQKAREDGLLPH